MSIKRMPGQPLRVTKVTLSYILHLLVWGRGSKTTGLLIPKRIPTLPVRNFYAQKLCSPLFSRDPTLTLMLVTAAHDQGFLMNPKTPGRQASALA